ncbi:J domain-containing protein [Kribbella sp. NPDC026596]|uniref:J domain-containing protein n=1 Tax=Kribbella sp. NPDC026596 TaxID=3155122 RepID=UPI0033F173B7
MTSTGHTDLYKVLGVSSDADAHQLDQAFRALARQHHPDARTSDQAGENTTGQPGDSQRFQEILAAYAVLRDPVARAAHDRATHAVAQTARTSLAEPAPPGQPAMSSPRAEPPLRVGPLHWAPATPGRGRPPDAHVGHRRASRPPTKESP